MQTLPASSRDLRPNGSVGLVDDDLAVRHLRRLLEDPLQLLVAHPLGCDTSRLVGLRRGVEEADRAHDAPAGVDEEVVAEAGQLAQPRRQTLGDLLRQFVLVTGVDTFVASHGRKHLLLLTRSVQGWRTRVELSCCAQTRFRKSKRNFGASAALRARSTRTPTITAISFHRGPPPLCIATATL